MGGHLQTEDIVPILFSYIFQANLSLATTITLPLQTLRDNTAARRETNLSRSYSVSEVLMREQGHRRLQARKEWSRTRVCENAHFSYVLALENKNGSA